MDSREERKDHADRRDQVVDKAKTKNHQEALSHVDCVSDVSNRLNGIAFVLNLMFAEIVVLICVDHRKRDSDSQRQDCTDNGGHFSACLDSV